MTAEEIRSALQVDCDYEARRGQFLNEILRELTAQLAEHNERMARFENEWATMLRPKLLELCETIQPALKKLGKPGGIFGI